MIAAEHAHRRVMRLHYLRGDRAAALAAFERCSSLLKRELKAQPGREKSYKVTYSATDASGNRATASTYVGRMGPDQPPDGEPPPPPSDNLPLQALLP